jgi:chromosome segregation ATPase
MSLKDFRTDPSDLPAEDPDNPAPASLFQDERHSLKLDRLSTRMTLVTILLPLLMGVALFFIYLDMKDRVMGMDTAKNTQVDQLSRQMEEKLNALDVRIAKNRFDLDEKLPMLEKKSGFMEQQLEKLAVSKADAKALEEGISRLEDHLARQDRRIQNNTDQDQANLAEMERINTTLVSALERNREQVDGEIRNLKQSFASLQTLKQEVVALQARIKDTQTNLEPFQKSLSRLETQVRDLENQLMDRTEITRRLMALETRVDQALKDLKKQIETPPLPIPDSISEETLTQ